MDYPQMSSAAGRQGLQSAWPWLLLGLWLMVSAAQIWALELEPKNLSYPTPFA